MTNLSTTSLKALLRFPLAAGETRSRFILGSVLVLAGMVIPILPGLVLAGYALRIMRQALAGEAPGLPAWEDWGGLLKDGFRWSVVMFVYFLPGTIALVIGLTGYIGGIAASIAESSGGAMSDTGGLLMLAGMGVYMVGLMVGMLLFMLAAVPLPVASAHFASQDQVAAAFHVRAWWPLLRVNKWGYLILWVIVTGLYSIMSLASAVLFYSLILCILVPFALAPATFYLSVISAGLFGQTYRESQELLAA